MMTKYTIFSLCLIFSIQRVWCSSALDKSERALASYDFDYLIFAQQWPATVCTQWQQRSNKNTCRFPNHTTSWTVHGIWPTKKGPNSPQNCPSSEHFNSSQLAPFMKDLEQHWTDIHANSKPFSFWEHEWTKHGTCATVLPKLSNIEKYFRQGIQWNKQFKLSAILNKGRVSPGRQGYNAATIANAVKAYTKTVPTIQCVIDQLTKQTLLSEIRLCFNKSLVLINCDQRMNKKYCKEPIMYDFPLI